MTMAVDIAQEIAEIQAAAHGSEVRQSMIDALDKLNAGALPAVSAADSGKILYVNANGDWVAGNDQYVPRPTGAKAITSNGRHDVAQYEYADVDVSGGTLTTKTVTENGTYNASDDSADGYSQVTVNVQGGSGLCYEWDFTSGSLVEKNSGVIQAELRGNAALTAGGVVIPDGTSAIRISGVAKPYSRYYVTATGFDTSGLTAGTSYAIIGLGTSYPSKAITYKDGILYIDTIDLTAGKGWTLADFDGKTMGIQHSSNTFGSNVTGGYALPPDAYAGAYGNGNLLMSISSLVGTYLYIGSPSNVKALFPMTIKKVKVEYR